MNGRLSFAYQWRRDGTPVQAGTGDTHAVQTCDQGADADVFGRDVERGAASPATSNGIGGRAATLPARDRQKNPNWREPRTHTRAARMPARLEPRPRSSRAVQGDG